MVASLDERLRDPESTQNLERAWLYSESARFVHAIVLPVDDTDCCAERMQLSGKRESRRSRADDENVGFAVNRHRTRIFPPRTATRSELGQVMRQIYWAIEQAERRTCQRFRERAQAASAATRTPTDGSCMRTCAEHGRVWHAATASRVGKEQQYDRCPQPAG